MKESHLKDYLTVVTKVAMQAQTRVGGYACFEHFVLENGRFMYKVSNWLPPGVKRGRKKMCFQNAAHLVLEHPAKFAYCEGYAVTTVHFPVLHAWVLDRQGNVVDNTWDDGEHYFGVAIDVGFLRKRLQVQSHYGLLDQPKYSWPLLTLPASQWRCGRGTA